MCIVHKKHDKFVNNRFFLNEKNIMFYDNFNVFGNKIHQLWHFSFYGILSKRE